ncbi:uncharacterized protein LOC143608392 [Bidens hawaiensis]|uniref:uncharacterized protein LOC143608392 n=1 Tax=Bidens hawaiensis TaxID=980011 RepID=UPI004049FA71
MSTDKPENVESFEPTREPVNIESKKVFTKNEMDGSIEELTETDVIVKNKDIPTDNPILCEPEDFEKAVYGAKSSSVSSNNSRVSMDIPKWLEPFGSICIVLEPTGKFGTKSMEGFFVGYASPLRRVYIPSLHKIVQVQNVDCQRYAPTIQKLRDSRLFDYESVWESIQLLVEDSSEETLMMICNQQLSKNQEPVPAEPVAVSQKVPENVQSDNVPETFSIFDDNGDTHEEIIEAISPSISHTKENVTNLQSEVSVPLEVVPRTISYHPEENIIGDLNVGVQTRRQIDQNLQCFYTHISPLQNQFSLNCFISRVEPKTYKEALTEESWVNAMQEELMQFEKLGVWKLVDLPKDKKHINTKWVFKCKSDENGIIVRNKIYVNDIIFGSTNDALCKQFEEVMKQKFEMSAMGEMKSGEIEVTRADLARMLNITEEEFEFDFEKDMGLVEENVLVNEHIVEKELDKEPVTYVNVTNQVFPKFDEEFDEEIEMKIRKIAVRRTYGVQYFDSLCELKSLPWLDVVDIVDKELLNCPKHGMVKDIWEFIKRQAKCRFRSWTPQTPYLHWWYYDENRGEAQIVLNKDGVWDVIDVMDPMWAFADNGRMDRGSARGADWCLFQNICTKGATVRTVANAYDVTRLFINTDIEEIVTFKKRFVEKNFDEISSSHVSVGTSMVSLAKEEFLNNNKGVGLLMEITVGGGSKTLHSSDTETTNWFGNGGDDTKKRKNIITSSFQEENFTNTDNNKRIRHNNIDDLLVEDDIIPKRPRGSALLNPSASVDRVAVIKNELSGSADGSTPQTVKLNGKVGVKSRTKEKIVAGGSKGNRKQGSAAVNLARRAKSDGSLASKDDVPLSSSSLGSKDEVNKLNKDEVKEISQKKDDRMGSLNGNAKRHSAKDVEVDLSDGNQMKEYLKRNGSKRKRQQGSNSGTVAKKVESSSAYLDPDDDLEQNAARMLSSRFDPSCTEFSLKPPILSANEGEDCEIPMAASGEAQDRVLRPRKQHKKGKGTSRKRRHFYEVHSDDMDAHWFLNRKIKIFWPLDESWYYGLVNDYDAEKNLHHIKYDDRDEEWISLESERFKLLLLPSELPHKPNTPVHMKDEALMESEPIISWLAHHRVKSPKLSTSRDVCNITERETDSPNCISAFFSASVEDDISNNGSEGHVPIVYVRRRRCHRFSDSAEAAPRSLSNTSHVVRLDATQLIQREKFEICIPLWPMLTYYVLGADIVWLLHSVVLLQFGTVVTMWPTVFLEVLFVDNIVGLRLFLFEGCLKQALTFVFLVMNVFCRPEKDESINHQIPVTSIRFKLSLFQNFRSHKVFAYYSFSKVRDFDWRYLDSEFKPQCLLSKHLPLSECTYDSIKLLQGVTPTNHIPYASQTEVLHKKSNRGGASLFSSSRSSKPVPGIRTIYSLRHGNVPPFALSFNAAPNLFISLHLKLLLEHSISLAAADDGDDNDNDDDDCSQLGISSESSSSKSSSHELHHAAIDPNFSESAGNSQGNKDSPTSNLKGLICVEIPTSDEVHRAQQHHASDLACDGIIFSPNQHSTGLKTSSWQHPWGDRKTDFFGNRPKKPRTQVQYTLPYSNKNKVHNNLPFQRIRKTNDKKISLSSSDTAAAAKGGGPRRNFELVACDANILINGGDKGWRECGARVFLEADQQNEWKLAVKCSGELKYAYKVHQDLQPGSTNRYTHAMMWKGGKDWALEFPERSQWFVFKEMHEECHNRNIRAASIKNIPIPGVRLIQADGLSHPKEGCFTRTPWYLRQVRDDIEMAMDASRVTYDMDSEDEEWVCRSRGKEGDDGIISDELFEKVMDMLEKVSYAQKRDQFSSGEVDELIARVTPLQVAKSIYDHWRDKRQRKGMPLLRQFQPPLWEKYQQTCREWEKLKPKPSTGPSSGSQEKAATAAAAADKPPMFAFCLKPRGLELLNRGSKHRPHKKISLSCHTLADHDTHHSGRRVHTYGFGDERADSPDVSPLVTKMYSPRDTGHFCLDGGDASDQQLRFQSAKSTRTLVSPRPSPGLRRPSSVKRNNSKKFNDWHNSNSSSRVVQQQQQLVLGGSDLDEFRLRDASSAAKHARNMAKLKRERAQKLMLSADLAIHKAVSALMTAEAIKTSCTGGDDSPPSSVS